MNEKSYQVIDWNDYSPDSKVLLKEKEKREAFTAPDFIINPVTQQSVDKNEKTIQELQTGFVSTHKTLLNNYTDLSNNVSAYLSQRNYLHENNDKYHYDDSPDPNILFRPEESKDIKSAIQADINEMKLYQNSIYITTAIACATLLIGTILMTKK